MEHTEAGVRIKSNRTRGNDISNLHYKNITMKNVTVTPTSSEAITREEGANVIVR